MLRTDICIAGAGVIGLSLALELQARSLGVTVIDASQPLREASWAAAGMLAAHDPHNPAELLSLANLSVSLYPEFLEDLAICGGVAVPFQTSQTLQSTTAPNLDFDLLYEHSIDPRQLASSLLAAVAATHIRLLTDSPIISTSSASGIVQITTPTNTIEAAQFVDCTGAWASDPQFSVTPIKGQMLAVALPPNFAMKIAVRTADIYIVPRTIGPSAGRAIIGATVEDAGFDKTVHSSQIEDLRQQAITLLRELTSSQIIDSWSGLRPATPDRLPLLGPHPSRGHHWVATGHYRNGILLAPATARVMTQMLLGEAPSISLEPFDPSRLTLHSHASSVPCPSALSL